MQTKKTKIQELTINLAGFNICIKCNYASTKEFLQDYASSNKSDFKISVSVKDIENEKLMSDDKNFSDGYFEQLALYRKIADLLLNYNVILFHGSAIKANKNAYIFTGKSGVGKSTHAALWRKYLGNKATMINDDKPLIKIYGEKIEVFGTPWDGKHHLSANISAPLKAICIIEQAEKNHIEPLSKNTALEVLLQQTHKPKNAASVKKILTMIEIMLSRIDFYKLQCMPNVEAVKLAYETLNRM